MGPDLDMQGFFNGTFYNCVSDEERLQMELILKKKGETLFTRKGKHWWLTGFILGEFSEPSDLTMDIAITLKDSIMRDAFLIGLKNAGYSEKEITIKGNKVSLEFNHTRTAQPISRIRETDEIIQSKNKFLCDNYRNITANYDNLSDKIMAIREQSPGLYVRIINIGKDKNIFRSYRVIKKYLN